MRVAGLLISVIVFLIKPIDKSSRSDNDVARADLVIAHHEAGWGVGPTTEETMHRRKTSLFIGVLMALSLIATACADEDAETSSDESTTTADSGSDSNDDAPAELGRGVTEDTVTIGYAYLEFDGLVEQGLSPAGWGDQEAAFQSVVDDPGGLVQIGYSARDAVIAWIDRRTPATSEATSAPAPAPASATPRTRPRSLDDADENLLSVRDLSVRFGGIAAVDGASLDLCRGEVVGLIGTNGAGKSTMLNAIGGYVPSAGKVAIPGNDMSRAGAATRAETGLGRTFQAATLFPELTVRDTLMVALEARGHTHFAPTVLGTPGSRRKERARASDAVELIDFLGLGRYADAYTADLSTGTRRIVELASLLAVDAQVLCLDEPTAGVAQRETEAFGPLILEIRKELGAGMIVIEHDMPLIMGISDRVYCLDLGRVIAEGPPDDVRNDPHVIASYLGTDDRAINRSDQPGGAETPAAEMGPAE